MDAIASSNNSALVAIRCCAYNQEPYIRDALEGFVMQKTDFPFVAIVHDDASTDGTAAIIREYAKKYPDIIKPIFEIENQYSKHDGSLRKIMNEACSATGAKYIAFCEGDDYWTDPRKLQKQVDIMESNPEITLCFHQVYIENGINKFLISKVEDRIYSPKEWYLRLPTQTSSYLCRLEVFYTAFAKEVDSLRLTAMDIATALLCSKFGNLYGVQDTMSVYRQLSTGWTKQQLSESQMWERINHHLSFKIFGTEIEEASKEFYVRDCIQFFITSLRNHTIKLGFIKAAWKMSPGLTCKLILRKFYNHC